MVGIKQEIMNSIKSEISGLSAQAAASEEIKLNVILFYFIGCRGRFNSERLRHDKE